MSEPAHGASPSGNRPWSAALAAILMGALGLGGGMLLRQQAAPAPVLIQPPAVATATPAPAPTSTFVAPVVFVSGAVLAPGVYQLAPGARVADALQAAGGLTADANPNAVNQAARLHDGDQVHIPTHAETPADPPAGVTGSRTGTVGESVEGQAAAVNINTASQTELETLPGIGPAKAGDIIANRPYAGVDDLLRVPGIGPATLERLRPHITVD